MFGWFRKKQAPAPFEATPRERSGGAAATLEPEPSAPPRPSAAAAPPDATRHDDGWFSREQVLEYETAENDAELARRLTRSVPTASREEALFRYRLSRMVYFQDFELPMLPATATEVMRLGRDPRASVRDYVRVIQSDPSLVSAVVRRANSSFYAAVSKCASLDQAIVRIGLDDVERIATIHIFQSRVFRVRGYDSLASDIVQHGVGVSIAAQWVLRRLGAARGEAFLAGLFHDVGKLFLLQTIGRVQQTLGWTAPGELVRSAFTAFHPAVGELVCVKWELPESVCQAVRWHHDVQRSAATPIGQATYLGNRIVHALERGDEDAAICADDDPVMRAAGLNPDKLRELRAYVAREIEAVRSSATTPG